MRLKPFQTVLLFILAVSALARMVLGQVPGVGNVGYDQTQFYAIPQHGIPSLFLGLTNGVNVTNAVMNRTNHIASAAQLNFDTGSVGIWGNTGFQIFSPLLDKMWTLGGIQSANFDTHLLYDGGGNNSVSYATRALVDASGNGSLSWSQRLLNDSSAKESIDWQNRILLLNDGLTISVDWQNGILDGNWTNTGNLGVGGNIYGSGSLSVATMAWKASPTNGNGIVMVGTSGGSATLQSTNLADAIQKATSSQFGTVKVDGTTITASGGVISSVGGSSSKDGSGFTNVLFQAYAGCNDSVAGLGIPVYMPINGYTTVRSASASSATNFASPAPFNMVLTNFYGFINVPQGTGTNEQMIVMTNGIASALTFTITGNGTIQSGSDNTHGVYITAGTLVALQSNPNNGLSALAIITWSLGAFKAP